VQIAEAAVPKREEIEELLREDLWELGRRAFEIRRRMYGYTTRLYLT